MAHRLLRNKIFASPPVHLKHKCPANRRVVKNIYPVDSESNEQHSYSFPSAVMHPLIHFLLTMILQSPARSNDG